MSDREPHPWDELAATPLPDRSLFSYSAERDWPGYFRAVQGRDPRETLVQTLDRFDNHGCPPDPFAIDLGCGEGRDTVEMLRRGWRVLAIDGHSLALDLVANRPDLVHPDRLETRLAALEDVELPPCDLLSSSFTLPFCRPDAFAALWDRVVASVRPGGRFAGQLFGDLDSWATIPDRAHHTRAEAEALLAPFDLERFDEVQSDGEDCAGNAKHWHIFHIIARKPGTSDPTDP